MDQAFVILGILRDGWRNKLSDKFSISVDIEDRLMHIRVWGFWCLDEAHKYRKELSRAMDVLGEDDPWNVIADVRLFPVQPAPVQKIHSELMRRALQMGMAKAANIVGGRLTRIQIEKLALSAWPEKGHFNFFSNLKDAEAWLKGGESGHSGGEDKGNIQSFRHAGQS